MESQIISKRMLMGSIMFSICIVLCSLIYVISTDRPKIVFCNVGQGDAIYIRTIHKIDILIDSGKGNSVLMCLGKHMPLYDRTIEYAFLTHPDEDHSGGYREVLKRYQVTHFYITADSDTKTFTEIKSLRKNNMEHLFQGDSLRLSGAIVDILWPTKHEVIHNLSTNNISFVFAFQDASTRVIFTGDIDPEGISHIMSSCTIQCLSKLKGGILKVPHHGSKNGLTAQFLRIVNPSLSIISVGKNSYGHPSREILDLLTHFHKKYLRTDSSGDIVIEYDEKGWRVK